MQQDQGTADDGRHGNAARRLRHQLQQSTPTAAANIPQAGPSASTSAVAQPSHNVRQSRPLQANLSPWAQRDYLTPQGNSSIEMDDDSLPDINAVEWSLPNTARGDERASRHDRRTDLYSLQQGGQAVRIVDGDLIMDESDGRERTGGIALGSPFDQGALAGGSNLSQAEEIAQRYSNSI